MQETALDPKSPLKNFYVIWQILEFVGYDEGIDWLI